MPKRIEFRSPLVFRDAQRRADKWAGTPDGPYLGLLVSLAKGFFLVSRNRRERPHPAYQA
jgi:hypothetical protein